MKLESTRARTRLLVIALAAALPAACSSDDDNDRRGEVRVTWRVPCGSIGRWDSGPLYTGRYVHDSRRQQVEATIVDSTGATVQHITRNWILDQLQWADLVGTTQSLRLEYDYDQAGRRIHGERIDRVLEDGDSSAVFAYGYDGQGAMVTYDVDYADPAVADYHSTILGDLTLVRTEVACNVAAPTVCSTFVFEQPDRNPDHWTSATFDYGRDGTINRRFTRTLDRNDLELTVEEFDVAGVLVDRYTTRREADGTVLGTTNELFDGATTPSNTYTVENQFTCAAAHTAPG